MAETNHYWLANVDEHHRQESYFLQLVNRWRLLLFGLQMPRILRPHADWRLRRCGYLPTRRAGDRLRRAGDRLWRGRPCSGLRLLLGSYEAGDLLSALPELLSNAGHEVLACLKLVCEVAVVASHLSLRRLKIFGEVSVAKSYFLRCLEILG
jgi:hypothetical protein